MLIAASALWPIQIKSAHSCMHCMMCMCSATESTHTAMHPYTNMVLLAMHTYIYYRAAVSLLIK